MRHFRLCADFVKLSSMHSFYTVRACKKIDKAPPLQIPSQSRSTNGTDCRCRHDIRHVYSATRRHNWHATVRVSTSGTPNRIVVVETLNLTLNHNPNPNPNPKLQHSDIATQIRPSVPCWQSDHPGHPVTCSWCITNLSCRFPTSTNKQQQFIHFVSCHSLPVACPETACCSAPRDTSSPPFPSLETDRPSEAAEKLHQFRICHIVSHLCSNAIQSSSHRCPNKGCICPQLIKVKGFDSSPFFPFCIGTMTTPLSTHIGSHPDPPLMPMTVSTTVRSPPPRPTSWNKTSSNSTLAFFDLPNHLACGFVPKRPNCLLNPLAMAPFLSHATPEQTVSCWWQVAWPQHSKLKKPTLTLPSISSPGRTSLQKSPLMCPERLNPPHLWIFLLPPILVSLGTLHRARNLPISRRFFPKCLSWSTPMPALLGATFCALVSILQMSFERIEGNMRTRETKFTHFAQSSGQRPWGAGNSLTCSPTTAWPWGVGNSLTCSPTTSCQSRMTDCCRCLPGSHMHCPWLICVGWSKRPACLMKQFSLLEIVTRLLLATCCSGSWSGNFKDTIVVDAHIFQHTPVEIGMESYLRTVLHASHGLNQLHSYWLKVQQVIPVDIHCLLPLGIVLTDLWKVETLSTTASSAVIVIRSTALGLWSVNDCRTILGNMSFLVAAEAPGLASVSAWLLCKTYHWQTIWKILNLSLSGSTAPSAIGQHHDDCGHISRMHILAEDTVVIQLINCCLAAGLIRPSRNKLAKCWLQADSLSFALSLSWQGGTSFPHTASTTSTCCRNLLPHSLRLSLGLCVLPLPHKVLFSDCMITNLFLTPPTLWTSSCITSNSPMTSLSSLSFSSSVDCASGLFFILGKHRVMMILNNLALSSLCLSSLSNFLFMSSLHSSTTCLAGSLPGALGFGNVASNFFFANLYMLLFILVPAQSPNFFLDWRQIGACSGLPNANLIPWNSSCELTLSLLWFDLPSLLLFPALLLLLKLVWLFILALIFFFGWSIQSTSSSSSRQVSKLKPSCVVPAAVFFVNSCRSCRQFFLCVSILSIVTCRSCRCSSPQWLVDPIDVLNMGELPSSSRSSPVSSRQHFVCCARWSYQQACSQNFKSPLRRWSFAQQPTLLRSSRWSLNQSSILNLCASITIFFVNEVHLSTSHSHLDHPIALAGDNF